ncbi:MAG: FHA domain-containing protein [Planctomycetota bacterium]|nr:MAG: FHA domain-containing protein [Planctomycetota bacterium]
MPMLLVKEKNNIVEKIALYKEQFSIGRALDNDLILTDTSSSRLHTQLTKDGSGYVAMDMNSSNGTFVNGVLIKTRVRLKDSDVIRIGDTELIFKDPQAQGAPADQDERPSIFSELEKLPGGQEPTGSRIERGVDDFEKAEEQFGQSIVGDKQAPASAQKPAAAQLDRATQNFFILYRLGKELNKAQNLEEMLDQALVMVFGVLKAERGAILLLEPDEGGQLQLTKKAQRYKGDIKRFAGEVRVSTTICNKVINDRLAILTADARSDTALDAGMSIVQLNIRSAMCVPLWDEETIRGLIYVDNLTETDSFTETDLELLTAVASQMALFIKKDELTKKFTEEAIMRANLERFHSKEEVEAMMIHVKQSGEVRSVALEVQEVEATVLFSDIVSFTPLSERTPPKILAELLNKYFQKMTEIVFANQGMVNKYIGDSVMAIFGANTPDSPGALEAVTAGLQMLAGMDDFYKEVDTKYHFKIRIGVNTGPVVAGMIGSMQKMEYTVLGDTVNVASRLEGQAEPNDIVLGELTKKYVKGKFPILEIGEVVLKGVARKTKAFRIKR